VIEAFSSGALGLVPLIALAGAGIAAVLLPDFAARCALWPAAQRQLMLFAALMALAALNKLGCPALGRGEPAPARFRRSVAAEYVSSARVRRDGRADRVLFAHANRPRSD